MSEAKEEKKDDDEDPRLDFIFAYLARSLRIKSEKWTKMLSNEDTNKIVMDFLDKTTEYLLIVTVNTAGQLIPINSFPVNSKTKCCYFIKCYKEPVTSQNYQKVLLCGDMSSKPIDELSVLVAEVFVPLLSNPGNHRGWPKVVAEDIQRHIHELKSIVYEVRGKITGHTLLPMPAGVERVHQALVDITESKGQKVDLYLKSAIEGVIIKWATQINEAVKEESSDAFENGQHPTPAAEILFWNNRLKNMENLYHQMRDPRVVDMASILELTDSAYFPCFKSMFRNVVAAVAEARDIVIYLKPLQKYFDQLENTIFCECQPILWPLMHTVCLVWANSRYYCNNSKITVLIKEICNLLIQEAIKYLDQSTIFQAEVEESYDKILKCIDTLELFHDIFDECRTSLASYFKGNNEPVPWTFDTRLVFEYENQFMDRLKLIKEFFVTALEFFKLEKVEIGGGKGRVLGPKVQKIYSDFCDLYGQFGSITYNPFDPIDESFVKDYSVFREKIEDFDRKLATLLCQAIDDCYNLESIYKFINIAGTLLERDIVKTAIEPKFSIILTMLGEEMATVQELFEEHQMLYSQRKYVPADMNFPPVAGAIMTIHKLRERVRPHIENLKSFDNPMRKSEEATNLIRRCDNLFESLDSFEDYIFTNWMTTVPNICAENLNKTILTRKKGFTLNLNFSEELVILLREVRYLKMLGKDGIPEEAINLHQRDETFRQWIFSLNACINSYNQIRQCSHPVEFDLVVDDIERIDSLISEAHESLNWNSAVWDFVDKFKSMVKQLHERVTNAQSNIKKIRDLMGAWSTTPLYERKERKKFALLNIEDRLENVQKRYNIIKETGVLIHNFMETNYNLYFESNYVNEQSEIAHFNSNSPSIEEENKNSINQENATNNHEQLDITLGEEANEQHSAEEESGFAVTDSDINGTCSDERGGAGERTLNLNDKKCSEKWLAYVRYVDEIVTEGLLNAIGGSLQFLMDEMDEKRKRPPLFEVSLELQEPDLVFVPSLDVNDPKSFYSLIQSIINDITYMATIIPRVAPNPGQIDYKEEMESNADLIEMKEETLTRVQQVIEQAISYCENFEEHSYLWLDDREAFLEQFLEYGPQLTCEEVETTNTGMEEQQVVDTKPTLQHFKEQIDHYENLYMEIERMDTEKIFSGWFRVNVRPFKQALLNTVCKWSNMLKQYLAVHVKNSLQELNDFIDEADNGLLQPVLEGDYDGLLKVMGYLFHVKERTPKTDEMFEPIKEMIDLLKTYDVEFSEEVYLQLQELPERWNATKKTAVTVKQQVTPLMAAEVTLIRKRINLFDLRQNQYREYFRKLDLFKYGCDDAYTLMDVTHTIITEMEEQMTVLQEQASLFEVTVPEYKQLRTCCKEIKMLKTLWDYIYIVRSYIDDWKTTPWKKIDVENMDQECKKFGKEIRGLDKEMRSWDAYLGLEATLKNLMTSLRAVTELQNPAIRERHWEQLMAATKSLALMPSSITVKFVMDGSTTLADLLALNLHEFEDEVKNIVDKSVKEMSMEKVLRELEITWAAMEFDHEVHTRTNCVILRASEELIETLEENQVQLQNLMSSKYIAYFLEEVSDWQRKLSNADQVISIWFEVQRTWMHLESIFIGSEDIRNQLPEDSNRFDKIDKEFREMLEVMSKMPNVVQATNSPHLFERLEVLQEQLTLCEKALAEYLETKRLAFPRFYFVSSADLLDILSNGNQPELVARHLTKLYDSLARLKFCQEDGKNTKYAEGMFAKDGEYVEFNGQCDCSGKVEVWLSRLTDTMRQTCRYYFGEAVSSYDEKPREQWLFDFPAQASLCGTQIWWTSEVNMSFSRLEEGFENALKEYQKKQIMQLSILISLLLGDLTKGDRQKIMTICTIDVHSRDVVAKMIQMKVESASAFQWQSQLRHRWDDQLGDCFCNICDAQFQYAHEYLGNTPRLVITPLTDRCYITLTQSLHLTMGGAPAGPAGTGKTETTKDLGRAMGVMVYVFNCSEQMDYKSCGNIYKGLAQTGAWGCFDEFNRISVEVLSVVAVQVKSVLDAIKGTKKTFSFMGQEIALVPTVGMFVTMNPGYAGRTELPENLKALFRPCAMVVPDFELICEIMLVAEGFQEARILARKFITLYTLCRELLSKQDHYDWGLRAIKSVLVVAGSLKRGDRGRPEDQVLMRALRDFNIPKIVTDDIPVFMGLIGDLFPALDVPRKRDLEFEKMVKQAALDLKLQPEDNFILKIVQLEELLEVRHSVFIVGNAGTGKTMVWRSLFKTYQNMRRKPVFNDLNPKAVTNDELFGIINPATREWKDGLLSALMRDQANLSGDGPKWIVLDGDIDPMWIESLNTVMDDNKILTLASNERIALTPVMRLLFEISSLRTATPATVSRAGILYLNPQDLGWNPYVTSWVETREHQAERSNLIVLFDKYIPSCLEALRTRFKKVTPIAEISHIQMLCHLLDCLIIPANLPNDCPKEWYEIYFVFACVWAFGAAICQDQLIDYRVEFSKWWANEFKTVKFPSQGTVFNYFVDHETKKFLPWEEKVQKFELDYDIPLQSFLVSTNETTRIRYFMDLLMQKRLPLMLVGVSGSGKSVIVADKLGSLSENYVITNVPFNFYTTSEMLQKVLEKPLEKKAGRNFGPPGNKTMIYFIDDMNMPEVDAYGTVQPHTLIRQYFDYCHWYDRNKLTLKDIHNCQYVSCMNPTSGSFTINPRLQRHFCVFAVNFPSDEPLFHIYHSILSQHLVNPILKFSNNVCKISSALVKAALALHQKMAAMFLPTALKFHYIFNLRDLSNIFQAMLFTVADCLPNQNELIRLWMHEATRVYGDKLVDNSDIESFNKILHDIVKKSFEELDESVFHKPLIFCHFADGIGESKYMPVKDWNVLRRLLEDALAQYNDLVAAMNLVMFEDAMHHVCRINRILESPRGNALLVGVGGSGKQSLSRLSAFISSLEVFQIQLRKGYAINDMKSDLGNLYYKAGLKSVGIMFLMTDSQVAEEKFLVLVNDMLASGEIPELFSDDEVENIVSGLRNEVKASGSIDNKENCWKFFIDRVRRQLKVVLCFSPVGSTLRVRARKFPAIVNCTSVNWFHEWPQKALESVSERFLSEISVLPSKLHKSVSLFMAYVHTVVNEMSLTYLQNERRYNYTTPKSFLEQISLYSKLLHEKTAELQARIYRLTNGLEKLACTAQQVDGLKEVLANQQVTLKEKNDAADKLIQVIGVETEKVSKEKAIAAEEERKVRIIEEDVSQKQKMCEEDLMKAEPALVAAQEALNTLNKSNLTELKSFGAPPPAVVNVTAAVMVLFAPKGRIPKDRSWKACKVMMAKVDSFLDSLIHYDKENIHPEVIKALQPYLQDPEFVPENIQGKSLAAAGLCAWVINIMKFYEVYVVVEPKRRALNQANAELAAARERLNSLKDQLNSLEAKLATLTHEFEEAVAEKVKCQQEADSTSLTIDLANRLVNGLGSENIRWRESVASLKQAGNMLPGDVLLVTAFISYVGCFTRKYRIDLQEKYWLPYLKKLDPQIPLTLDVDPLTLLTDDAQIAKWNNEGLPSDRMSAENATILTNSTRWPLMIDPQLQGIKWIKNKYGESLKIVRLGQKMYLEVIEGALSNGDTVLIENIGESIDAVLDPLLSRNLIKKGKAIKIGDREVDYNPNFRLILHTKLANPHYKPEMQAQTTLINFTVTRDGLEEQLLAEVVKAERPDLEKLKADLTKQQNDFKITLKMLEDDLLHRLASAGENILKDTALVINLETTKKTAAEIEIKVSEAKVTSVQIDEAREQYRSAATRASLLYFILNDLHKINPIYQFSLKAFSVVFYNAMMCARKDDNIQKRVFNLIDSITFGVYMYTSRGLFECDKLIFMAQMAIQILLMDNEIDPAELDFLLRYPANPNVTSPVDFLTNLSWGGIKTLSAMDEFRNLDRDIEASVKRWKKFVESETPEREKFPQEWKNKSALQRLCMLRALRPDRMTYAMRVFIEEKLGSKYIESWTIEFSKSYEEMSSSTPVFFILSPGVDPLKDVEKVGRKLGFTFDKHNFHNVSLGQGQEVVAEEAMDIAAREGHWVILQNIHLVKNWLPYLEKKMEHCAEIAHPNFRLFMSAEPSPDPAFHIIPQGILESSIKITNEPPTGMLANLHKALDNFSQETLEMSTKEAEFKAILFSLCYFHAVIAERRKFGPQGWNRIYPFNVGDLTISVNVLYNYLENSAKVPWEDLRYLFGEIMYGGHITDDWDRHLCRTYLSEYLRPELLDGDLSLAPGFLAPPNTDLQGYHNYIDAYLPAETPYLYGLHPNAEIGFLTTTSETLFRTVLEMQPREAGACGTSTLTREEKVKQVLDDILDKLPEGFNIAEIMAKVEERTPYIIVAFQECERMNILSSEMKQSLRELDLGLKGELTITTDMEELEASLFMDQVPARWTKLAYPSMMTLGPWFADFMLRLRELEGWSTDFQLPSSVWLAGFFNPQSFLTAIMQSTARKNEWPLDRMCLHCEVTKKQKEEFTTPPREGAYIHSLFMEGARWDPQTGAIVEARLKELFPTMPVIFVKAITQDKQDLRNMYECPVYKTRVRNQTYVWTFNLRTREKPAKWTLAGVAILLQI
ncbi:dynein beta chain, ciliary-like [Schistocerca gregaria]|uniref:dynein beta chain, ciliary-like n=1 Tax=Schistocerca gregaria TaxID=7010 RepID=UPI00211E21EC|nr:dynein beta chain, ciliary-like [Schistocerca gregaria]